MKLGTFTDMNRSKGLKRSGFKKKPKKPLKRGKLRKMGKSSQSRFKTKIQGILREKAIERDGGCVLRHHVEAGQCGGYKQDGTLILQAEHLNGRSHAVSFAEMENIVCLCNYHHIFFKKQNPALYWVLIRKHVGEERWAKVQAWILDKKPYKKNWVAEYEKMV